MPKDIWQGVIRRSATVEAPEATKPQGPGVLPDQAVSANATTPRSSFSGDSAGDERENRPTSMSDGWITTDDECGTEVLDCMNNRTGKAQLRRVEHARYPLHTMCDAYEAGTDHPGPFLTCIPNLGALCSSCFADTHDQDGRCAPR